MLDTRTRPPATLPGLERPSRLKLAWTALWRAAWRATWRAVKRLLWWVLRQGWRQRRRLAPVYAAAVVWVTGALLSVPADGWRTALSLAGLCTLGGAVWWWRSRRGGHRWGRRRQAYVLAAYTAAWAWITVASVVGPGPPMPGLLMVATLGGGIPWWWHHRIRPTPPIDQAVARWDEAVASPSRALPGSWIAVPEPVRYAPPPEQCDQCDGDGTIAGARADDDLDLALDNPTRECPECGGTGGHPVRPIEVGWQSIITLPPGKLTTTQAIRAVEPIASAYSVPLPSVAVEETATGEFDRALIRVYSRNPLRDVRTFPGPQAYDPATGVAQIGVYVDQAPVLYRFWEPDSGPLGDLISGTIGAGKSSVLNVLLTIERHHGMISVVIDPKRGASLPDWQDSVARWAGTAQDGVELLLEMERVMLRRNQLLGSLEWTDERGRRRKGISFFDPTFEPIGALGLRLLNITIDEAHQVLEYPEAARAAEAIAKMGRSTGMKLRLVTQVPLVDQLGGSSTLKELVRSGNVICLRTGGRLSGEVAFAGELPVDPVMLPRHWPDGSSTAGLCFIVGEQARTAQARLFHPGDSYGWAHRGATVPLEELPEEDTPQQSGEPAGLDALNGMTGDEVLEGMVAVRNQYGNQPPPGANGGRPAGTARERIVALLAERGGDGASVGVIADRLGMPMSTAATALKEAQQAGQVVQPRKRGPWVIAGG